MFATIKILTGRKNRYLFAEKMKILIVLACLAFAMGKYLEEDGKEVSTFAIHFSNNNNNKKKKKIK